MGEQTKSVEVKVLEPTHGVRSESPILSDSYSRKMLQTPWIEVFIASIFVALGMAYSFWWGTLVLHVNAWVISADIWGTFRAAQDVGWGYIGGIYTGSTGMITFPGIAIVLAPIAMLSGLFGLSTSFPFILAHPTAWIILGPVALILGSLPLFPIGVIAGRMGMSNGRRVFVMIMALIPLWVVSVTWGHPEVSISFALALWGVFKGYEGNWRACGWLFGFAIAFQPFVLLMLAVLLFSRVPIRLFIKMLLRSAAPSVLLLAIPFIQNWHATSKALISQPTFPGIDHATPLLRFAPIVTRAHWQRVVYGSVSYRPGSVRFINHTEYIHVAQVVGGGPNRSVAIVLACFVGWWLRKRRLNFYQLLWWIGVGLSLWSALESVMTPYYLDPSLIILFLLAARTDVWRFIGVTAIVVSISVYSEHFYSPWVWWTPIVVLTVLGLAITYPTSTSHSDYVNDVNSLEVMEEA